MFAKLNPLLWSLGIIGFAAVLLLLRSLFNAKARLQRRRRKNYRRTVSKHRGPAIKLAVKTKA